MLRLDRVGSVMRVPLARDLSKLGTDVAPAVAEVLRQREAPYEGVTMVLRLIGRAEALLFGDQLRRQALEAEAGALSLERLQAIRAEQRAMVQSMVLDLEPVEIGGAPLVGLSPEERAQAIDDASMMRLLPDVAARAYEAQTLPPAAKNSCASSPPPSGDALSNAGT